MLYRSAKPACKRQAAGVFRDRLSRLGELRRELRCFWPNFYDDVPVGSLDPDIVIGWRFEDYRRGVDTVLKRALAESR